MLGIDIEVAFHRLVIDSKAKPVSQKKRKMAGEKRQAARRDEQTAKNKVRERNKVPHLVVQHGSSQEKQREVEDVHWFYKSEQGLLKRLYPPTKHKQASGRNIRVPNSEPLGCVTWSKRLYVSCLSAD